MSHSEAIKQKATACGFDIARITPADLSETHASALQAYISDGRHGDMAWMAETVERRQHPRALWPDAKSVVVLGMTYGPDEDPLAVLDQKDRAGISVYARNRDYHDLIKKRLKQIGRWMAAEWDCDVKVFVDTAPVLEKPLAHQAGVGWQGKHSNLVSREFGSWLFLGEIFTTLNLEPDLPETDHCGSCRACLDVCPTDAFPQPYSLDARRCISYLTIEHKGPIPKQFRHAMGNRIYGCDDCLAICPWNKFAQTARQAELIARDDLNAPPIKDLLTLDDAGFRELFRGSPIKRIGRDRFLRNVLIAAGNSEDASFIKPVVDLLDDPSALVRGAAVWALKQLSPDETWAGLQNNRRSHEHDVTVIEEWDA